MLYILTQHLATIDRGRGYKKRKDPEPAIKTPSKEEEHQKRCGIYDKSLTSQYVFIHKYIYRERWKTILLRLNHLHLRLRGTLVE